MLQKNENMPKKTNKSRLQDYLDQQNENVDGKEGQGEDEFDVDENPTRAKVLKLKGKGSDYDERHLVRNAS